MFRSRKETNWFTDLTNKVLQTSEKGYKWRWLSECFSFGPIFSLLIFDSNKKVTHWMLRGIPSEKVKPFHINLKPGMSNLANCWVTLKKYRQLLPHCIVTSF